MNKDAKELEDVVNKVKERQKNVMAILGELQSLCQEVIDGVR